MPVTPEVWEGDALPESDEEAVELFDALGCLPSEIEAMADHCKREAWVHEKLAKHEGPTRAKTASSSPAISGGARSGCAALPSKWMRGSYDA